MSGRAKAQRENIVTLAHQIEAMHRQKKLRTLDQYLGIRTRRHGTDEGVISVLEAAQERGLISITERPKG